MLQGLKLAVALVHPYILAHHSLFSPYLFPYAWQKERGLEKRRKRWKKEVGRNTRISKVLPSLPP
jgi:hypothetical protein